MDNHDPLQDERTNARDVVSEVMAELEKAIRKFPTWPTDPLHAVGVFNEEAGELAKAVLQQVYEPHKNPPGAVRSEARQAAAMALRFLVSIDTYDWTPGAQHEQPSIADRSTPTAPLLTETADYDEPGSWGRASAGWPELHGDKSIQMRTFIIRTGVVPYGSYVTLSEAGKYGATESVLRIHPDYIEKARAAFASATAKPEDAGKAGS